MASFSRTGTPYNEQSPPNWASHPGKLTFWCVNVRPILCMSTPRSVANREPVRLMPASTRPPPSVCARSAKIGPADVDVRTGTPPSKRKVSPPLVDPLGMLATLAPSASVMKAISEAFSALDDGMKWRPWACSEIGLLGSPDPARKSGLCPAPKMKRSDIRSRRPPWAFAAVDGMRTITEATSANVTEVLRLAPQLRMRGPEACELATRSNGNILAALPRVGNADELGRSESGALN